ncbi:MAG: hypothetical protein O3A66_01400 [Proteobacteria bacterium]|jgi:hypothetical protein|nr:hypothetical protein [Pseudomonadota bacterium]
MKLFFAIIALLIHFSANASRGWYISASGLSSKQSHTVSDYASTSTVKNISQSYSTASTSVTNAQYDFTQTTTTPSGYVSFTTLNNAITNAYINSDQTFYLATNDSSGAIAPIINDEQMTTTGTGSSSTTKHLESTIATVTYTGSNGIYQVNLYPKSWSANIDAIEVQVQSELTSSLLTTTAQLQNFLESFQDGSTGMELSLGYKFRPFQSSWFLAPQVDLSYFGTNTQQTAYSNTAKTSFSQTKDSTHTTSITRDTLNSSMAFSMVGKLGYENSMLLGLTKIPFNIYGILGGTSAVRKYHDIRTNNLGAKYGIGGEIFLSHKLALFAEFYQIHFFEQNVDYQTDVNYTNSTTVQGLIDAGTGTSVIIKNDTSSSTTGYKETTLNYSSLGESMGDIKYQLDEVFKIQTKTSAFKVGLTYYF